MKEGGEGEEEGGERTNHANDDTDSPRLPNTQQSGPPEAILAGITHGPYSNHKPEARRKQEKNRSLECKEVELGSCAVDCTTPGAIHCRSLALNRIKGDSREDVLERWQVTANLCTSSIFSFRRCSPPVHLRSGMSDRNQEFLRRVLGVDAAVCLATGIGAGAFNKHIAPYLAKEGHFLSDPAVLRGVGAATAAVGVGVAVVAAQETISFLSMSWILAVEVAWLGASGWLLASQESAARLTKVGKALLWAGMVAVGTLFGLEVAGVAGMI